MLGRIRRILAVLCILALPLTSCVAQEPLGTVRVALGVEPSTCEAYCIETFYVRLWDAYAQGFVRDAEIPCGSAEPYVFNDLLAGMEVKIYVDAFSLYGEKLFEAEEADSVIIKAFTVTEHTASMVPASGAVPQPLESESEAKEDGGLVSLVIRGTGFGIDPTEGDTHVAVDGKIVESVSWSDTEIVVNVETAASSLAIEISRCGIRSEVIEVSVQ